MGFAGWIGDVSRRIIAKAILYVVHTDIHLAAGALQTCAGHDAGAEAAIHAMREIFARENTDAVLLVDASNAFNQVNHQSALHNISILCPSFATILKNTYGVPIRLFITGEGEIRGGSRAGGLGAEAPPSYLGFT